MDKLMDILKTEYVQALAKVDRAEQQANTYVNYILIFTGAVAAFLALQAHDDTPVNRIMASMIIVGSCIIAGLLIIMMAHYTVQSYRIGGYLKYLEEKINSLLGEDILKWEKCASSKHIHKSASSILIFIIVVIVFVVLMAVSVWFSLMYIWKSYPISCAMMLLIGLIETVALCFYVGQAFTSHKKFYDLFMQATQEHTNL